MNLSIFAINDATIYESHKRRNTGIDQILELEKIVPNVPDINGSYWDNIYVSRFLIKFDVNYIKKLIDQNIINRNAKYYLSVKATEAIELPINYTIEVHPLSQNWDNGQGHYNDYPEINTGVSWQYTDGYFFDSGNRWISGSFNPGVTGSYHTVPGGGTWYTGSSCYQTLDYVTTPDLRINVTSIVKKWISGSIPNYGFLVKHADELERSSIYVGSLKFFAKDSHTVYLPKLEAVWNDATFTNAESIPEVGENFTVHLTNIRNLYRSDSKEIIRVFARDTNPIPTYATSSRYLQLKRLPTSSYYAIQDSVTTEYITAFDTGSTQLSCDAKGNFFRVDMRTLLPDRYYKFIIKTIQEGGLVERVFDEGYYFKVMR